VLGFGLDGWDYLTFAVMFVIGMGAVAAVVFVLGLPGRIAVARKHPDAEAVTLLGWAGGLAVLPWMKAFIWAFKPTEVIDVRRMPVAEQQVLERQFPGPKAVGSSVDPRRGSVEPPADGESPQRNERVAS
jgi:Protein of unknown function (DUF3302)